MLYLFYGIEDFVIQKKIESILKNTSFKLKDVIKKSFTNNSLSDLLNEVEQLSLFGSNNFVVGDNFEQFLSKKQENKDAQLERLIEFSKKQNDSILILICNKEKIIKDNFSSKLGEFAQIIECKKLGKSQKRKIITTAFKNRNINISSILVDYFIERSSLSIRGLISEIDKISLFNNKANKELIDKMVSPIIKDNIFSLIESILNKDISKSMNKYEQLVNSGTSPIAILTLVGNEIALMSALVSSENQNIPSAQIASIFKKPAFVVSKAYKKLSAYNKNSIININEKIAKIEYEIKTGKINQNIFIQFFIYKLIKEN